MTSTSDFSISWQFSLNFEIFFTGCNLLKAYKCSEAVCASEFRNISCNNVLQTCCLFINLAQVFVMISAISSICSGCQSLRYLLERGHKQFSGKQRAELFVLTRFCPLIVHICPSLNNRIWAFYGPVGC